VAAVTELAGAVVIVTGAGSGIGRATVSAFSAAGAHVLAAGRSSVRLEETVALAKAPELVTPIHCDVAIADDVAKTVGHALARFGRLDCAFNNAGTFGRLGLLHEDDEDNFNTVVDTNLRGLWLCLKHQIPAMVAQGGGSIVNCASTAAHRGHPMTAIYSATKHAVIGLSRSAALQYAAAGIRVNVVSPGATDTDMLRSLYPSAQALEARASRTPLQRLATAEEVANAVLWLAGPLASYVTGQTLIVDGGVTAA
jgi:NAD(P)-dependent dehydrogenase (short-subunit alcohol dehydrogenase family)